MIKLTSQNQFYSLEDLVDDCSSRLGVPSFQRTFCWNCEKIYLLFDSILRNFYIGTIHLARIPDDYLKANYINNTNTNLQVNNPNTKYLVLDGLQRLTAINIALSGTFNDKPLYINLNYKNESPGINESVYSFKFLDPEKAEESPNLWFKVSDILKARTPYKIHRILEEDEKFDTASDDVKDLAESILEVLVSSVQEKSVPVHIEEGDEDSCIESFVRINKGGVSITVSDIVFAKIQLYSDNLTRNYLESVVNLFQQRYDYQGKVKNILNCLLNFLPNTSRYSISSFNKESIEYLNNNYVSILASLERAMKLLKVFNISVKYIPDTMLVILSQYLYDKPDSFISSTSKEDSVNKLKIFKYLILSTLKRDTGTGGNKLRNIVSATTQLLKGQENFNYVKLLELEDKTASLSDDEIELLLNAKYNSIKGNFLLYLLFHKHSVTSINIDHIYPISQFKNTENFDKANSVVNLEILDSVDNVTKNAKDFSEWIETRSDDFCQIHLIPKCNFEDFNEFYNIRRELLKQEIKNLLTEEI